MNSGPEQTNQIVHAVLMSGFMSTALSGVFTWFELGFTIIWLSVWIKSIFIAWPIAFLLDRLAGKAIKNIACHVSGAMR